MQYVNDENPEPVNFIVDMAFEQFKVILKRDLKNTKLTLASKLKTVKKEADQRKKKPK